MICFKILDILAYVIFQTIQPFYACDKDVISLINRLEHDSYLGIEWFENNFMKLNQDKCHLLALGFKCENAWMKIGEKKLRKYETGTIRCRR